MAQFLYTHFVLAQIVSSDEVKVEYANQFLSQNDGTYHDGVIDEIDNPEESNFLGHDKLWKHERAILEYSWL